MFLVGCACGFSHAGSGDGMSIKYTYIEGTIKLTLSELRLLHKKIFLN